MAVKYFDTKKQADAYERKLKQFQIKPKVTHLKGGTKPYRLVW